MITSRREFLAVCASAASALAALPVKAEAARDDVPQPLGVVIHSYGLRSAADRARAGPERIDDAFTFLDYCRALGARGVQVGLGTRTESDCDRLRDRAAAFGMYLEGMIRLPRDPADVDRFEAEARTAARAGATVLRVALLSGRRYETFATATAFRRFADESARALGRAVPLADRHGVRLAIENHKDFRTDELLALLKPFEGGPIGICLDTGNSIALLEDPMEVVEALAPLALTTHIKDMGMREYPEGFLLSEVPLGDGILDLTRIGRVLRAAHPEIRMNLEMITRDPLRVPCLTPGYWATFDDLSGRHLARTLALVRARAEATPLPGIAGMTPEERLRAEDANVRLCLARAKAALG